MAFGYDDIPDLTGKTVVVTGGNSGLGFHTVRGLAGAGARVFLTSRDVAKGEAAVATIRAQHPEAAIEVVPLDLADRSSIDALSKRLHAEVTSLDILVNNAGVMMTPQEKTADGFELQLGTNHLGHFALTGLLLDLLLAAPAPRVVTVSSFMHHAGTMRMDDLFFTQGGYDPTRAYSQSKLANLLFARELDRRAREGSSPLVSTAAHPGYAATNLQHAGSAREGGGLKLKVMNSAMKLANRVIAQPAEDGALPQIYAAVSSDVAGGTYWGPTGFREQRGPTGPAKVNPKARDEAVARDLFDRSMELTSVDFAALTA